ncbi:hypothetical protein BLNAU_2826 [Blattamonas nauphoetae]|uniref:Pre-mRNA polyadenylation factor Fip1 domain-containing protein n=1 Tax=Blattamonas nauphoetae TaxID=2049346 RepID=A0ABQ9YEW2_9EUKA|nr:hypothetical protein BLNAU_2826 [Blattamonas nauphoetae]
MRDKNSDGSPMSVSSHLQITPVETIQDTAESRLVPLDQVQSGDETSDPSSSLAVDDNSHVILTFNEDQVKKAVRKLKPTPHKVGGPNRGFRYYGSKPPNFTIQQTSASTNKAELAEMVKQLDQALTDPDYVPMYRGDSLFKFNVDSLGQPWEKSNAQLKDYFNYGFDETTWKFEVTQIPTTRWVKICNRSVDNRMWFEKKSRQETLTSEAEELDDSDVSV